HKAQIVREAIEGKITPLVPASALQTHSNTTFLIEKRSASTLSRITYPWLFFEIDWNEIEGIDINRAIIWLSTETNKPIDQLDLQDFHNNFLSGLAKTKGYKVSDLTKAVINRINDKIFYKEKFPRHKKVLVISVRPGDDAIIGDIIRTYVRNENYIKIINMVSGNINVKNSDVIDYCEQNNIDVSLDTIPQRELLQLKTLVRKAEAIELHAYLGVSSENLYFLNLPFYEVENIEERVITEKDIDPLVDILNMELPDIIISPEAITDPHGLKENIVKIVDSSLKRSSIKNVEIWQYKTVMEDFSIPEGDIIFPFNEQDMDLKIAGIKRLKSQDTPILPGYDPRSLWYRIKERNQRVGDVLTTIGLVSNEYRYVTIIKVHQFER
ncbi:MAG: PIG-L family deacetylase, partial [Candidatus Heimdallarchaeota archaeon]